MKKKINNLDHYPTSTPIPQYPHPQQVLRLADLYTPSVTQLLKLRTYTITSSFFVRFV